MGVSDPDRLEQITWALPKELGNYDFLAANGHIVARLATGNIKPSETTGCFGFSHPRLSN